MLRAKMYHNFYWEGNQEGDLVSANFELKYAKDVMKTSYYLQYCTTT